jgi:hypothetical protein
MSTARQGDEKKAKALELALSQIQKQHGEGAVMRLGQEPSKLAVEAIPTGALTLDIALGIGGLPRGRLVEIYGNEGSGKTTLALNVLAQAQRLGGTVAFIDAEHAFPRELAETMGLNLDELLVSDEDEAARALLASLTPEHGARIRFLRGVTLVGYTLTPSLLVPGERATLRLVWELEGEVKHNFMQVFVHFRDEKRRVFQADHNAVLPVAPGTTVPRVLVLDEHEFTVPADAPTGELTIYLGVTSAGNRPVRLKPRTKLPVWNRAIEIGRAEIGR